MRRFPLLLVSVLAIALTGAPARDARAETLHLDVTINGHNAGLIAAFTLRPGGKLAIAVDELRELRIRPDDLPAGPDGMVDLDRCSDLTYRYDRVTQSIRITVQDTRRVPYAVHARAKEDTPPPSERVPGGVLNYTLFGTSDADVSKLLRLNRMNPALSAGLDARVFGAFGTLSQTAVVTTGVGVISSSVRLDTTWSYADPETMLTARAGDIISGGLAWTRPVRLGGVQISRNFGLRPDLVTLPLPQLSGSAAVPSAVDVFVNNARVYSVNVPPGPFALQDLPVIAGGGVQRAVVRDSLGRETVIEQPFYASTRLLATGLTDFSLETGFTRQNYGVRSFDYRAAPAASGSVRYGATDWLSLEAHGEGGDRLINAGAGASVPILALGAASLAVAASRDGDGSGMLVSAAAEFGHAGTTLTLRTQRASAGYSDLASLPSSAAIASGFSIRAARPARALDQIAIGVPVPFDRASLSLSLTQLRDALDNRSRIVGATYSRALPGDASLFVMGFTDLGDTRSTGIFAGITITMRDGITATGSASSSGHKLGGGIDLVKSQPFGDDTWSWRLRDREGTSAAREAAAGYRTSFARFEGGVQQFGSSTRALAQAEGALAVIDGHIFATNRIDDAFAVVDAGAPDVEVLSENRAVTRTNASGVALIPSLRSFQKNSIAIDARKLPADADIPRTRETVVPPDRGAALVRFGIRQNTAQARVLLVDPQAKAIPVGSRARLPNADGDSIVGYDGELFLKDLGVKNTVRVTRPDGRVCDAVFAFKATPPGIPAVLRNVVCR